MYGILIYIHSNLEMWLGIWIFMNNINIFIFSFSFMPFTVRQFQSDRIIHEQQLGIEWMAPEDSWTSMLDGLQQGNGESSLDQDEPDHELNVNQSTGPNPRLLAKVLDLVYDELNFLVDSKVEASCASLSVDEAKLLKVGFSLYIFI